MNDKIKKLLAGNGGNYILPFFWQHGEEGDVLRNYMKVIHDAGIGAVCIESRPHPDFCGPKWWQDMDIILEEAVKHNMKVWILDDSHFPTGFCNGALQDGPDELRRQSVTYQIMAEVKDGDSIVLYREDYAAVPPFERNLAEQYLVGEIRTFTDDLFLGVVAVKAGGKELSDLVILKEENGEITFTAADGCFRLYACYLTRNRGPHRDYMNMTDEQACHKLIETVYEPHYARYKEKFGTVIAGFFSDEAELGNGHLYELNKTMEEVDDQPFGREIEANLKLRWGQEWLRYIPLLWEREFAPHLKARVRYEYMDIVTRCVEKDFSYQIGDWCRARGVEYIGHLIEDNNQHSRCGSSLGHFFRGLAGQDMAGIDDIGGQVLPQKEDDRSCHSVWSGERDGVFYHYALGKLAASAAAIEPLKKGRAMCEIFGNYGWEEGVYLEKYLADHFMVRGINYFVPHAFSAKPFPDPDCPPHFYAHGHNPQYRHFGKLMDYMNRVCELISDGCHVAPAAILYHGEADWTGGTCMFSQEPARELADHQIDYDFIPADVFAEDKYGTLLGKTLKVNTQEYRVLIVPETSYVTAEFARAAAVLSQNGFPVLFINRLPEGICTGEIELLKGLALCKVIKLDQLPEFLETLGIPEVTITPAQPLIRYLHYVNENHLFYFVNESAKVYQGEITMPAYGHCYAYNAWDNRLEYLQQRKPPGQLEQMEQAAAIGQGGIVVSVILEPRKSLIIIFDVPESEPWQLFKPVTVGGKQIMQNEGWLRSVCRSIDYPDFTGEKEVNLPDRLEEEQPEFGGVVRYEKTVLLSGYKKVILEITNAAEGVEVFVNGASAGIQIVPTYRYDITGLVTEGGNDLVIEVATTLERVIPRKSRIPGQIVPLPANKCGIHGEVSLWVD